MRVLSTLQVKYGIKCQIFDKSYVYIPRMYDVELNEDEEDQIYHEKDGMNPFEQAFFKNLPPITTANMRKL